MRVSALAVHRGLAGLGLAPGDPCYDSAHPWYLPNFLSDAAECQCMADHYGTGPGQYTCGQQCVGYGPPDCTVGSVMGQQAGAVVGTVAGEVASGIGAGIGSGAGAAASSTSWAGMAAIAGAVVLGIVVLSITLKG